ncbi:simple sugar transport system permease protein [Pseudoduganella lurida]|uniref:Simple sugar transport system permease protein n=1 Tax=Pseudoduganella lurida TaxID=1036180 RepID=A0A562R3M6_9BURK|nr:ABC transporter permease [Pseudoduganella lurida]TWI63651.1 simple sugar transport system permease protein [Pseudoduganella lurida]
MLPISRRLLPGLLSAVPTLCALLSALAMFMLFLLVQGQPVLEACALVFEGAFGSSFAWQNTLQRAAPLMFTALCVALPARTGLVIIGGEGALALGGLAAAIVPLAFPAAMPGLPGLVLMGVAGALAGGLWIGLAGWLRQARGINETIGSLLLAYIALAVFRHLVEGPLRDPASLNKPSTLPLPDHLLIGTLPGLDVHWGLVWGVLACVAAHLLVRYSTLGFTMSVTGGNVRAAKLVGLPVGRIVFIACLLGGAAAGLAGMFEVAAVHGNANTALLAGYGYSGILVAFAARQNPLAVIVCAIFIGGIESSGSLLQRRLDLPDATTLVLQGLLFTNLLACEAFTGRLAQWRLRLASPTTGAQHARI